jgi:hypothetical protein
VKLVATDTPQFMAGIGELGHPRTPFSARTAHFPFPPFTNLRQPAPSVQRMLQPPDVSCAPVPKGILCNPSNQRKQPLALTSPTWARGLTRVLRESACPHGAKNREKQNSCFSTKPCQVVAHARARVGKIRFFDHPYNPRMLTQGSVARTNPDKAEAKAEPGGANTLPWPLGGLAAMGRVLGRRSRGFLLASPVWVSGAKRMGAIHRLWTVPAVTGVRACVRGRQLRRVTVRCQSLDECRRLSEIISREIAGNRRGTGGLHALALPPLEELLSEQIVLMPTSPTLIDCADSSGQIESAA